MRLKRFTAVVFAILVSASALYASDVYDTEPSFSPYYAGSVKSSVLYEALEELNYIRWLAGVPNNVTLNSDYTRKAQHGSVLLDAIDTLTHTPGRPSDMSDTFYQLGYDGTTHGNIAVSKMYMGSQVSGNITIPRSLRLYMEDSDSSNIAHVGHRRWLMNPRMTQTGFGISTRRGYSVTYVIEESNTVPSWPITDEFITWPANKHPHPLEYFDAGTAWSITLNREVFSPINYSSVNVRLIRERNGQVWNFSRSTSNGYFSIAPDNVAYDECIIFRPDNVTGYNTGETWRVEVSGLSRRNGGTGTLSYRVQFTGQASSNDDQPTPPPTPDNGYHHYYFEDDKGFWSCNSGYGALSLLILALGIPRRHKRAGK